MSDSPAGLTATVVIATKNRSADLAIAIESALAQTARPEVLVIDDGSTDGTSQMVAEKYPEVRLDRAEISRGYIVQRNRAAQMAKGQILFSIDDDAAFSSPRVVEQTLTEFDHPRVGAVAIPFADVRKSPRINQWAPSAERIYVSYSYIGTAHALRRDLFLRMGGYRDVLIHQGEEQDFTVRILDAGYITRTGRADPIHHFESPHRDEGRATLHARRNEILYAWHNVPMPYFPFHLTATMAKGLLYGFRRKCLPLCVRGELSGLAAMCGEPGKRRPVRGTTYRLSRWLRKHDPSPLASIESRLPPI
ncbi:MAG TPA: glycosyltransferase family 2 protein [Tepidisphaeraceae bacterium]|nr:glycosyltransferase family 2 protein [Tepidisphaeraceae bacterium]